MMTSPLAYTPPPRAALAEHALMPEGLPAQCRYLVQLMVWQDGASVEEVASRIEWSSRKLWSVLAMANKKWAKSNKSFQYMAEIALACGKEMRIGFAPRRIMGK